MNSFIMITGASGGLGQAFVHECASRGFNLFLTDLSPEGIKIVDELASSFPINVRYQA